MTTRLIRWFVARYKIDLREVAEPDVVAYISFNDFFTRALKNMPACSRLPTCYEHPSRPSHRVVFFRAGGKGVKPNARKLARPAQQLEHFHALLLNAMRTTERDRLPSALPATELPAPELGQRIEKLWELHQAGALTEAEFIDQKQRLLQSDAQ